jgi:hypothetical protein
MEMIRNRILRFNQILIITEELVLECLNEMDGHDKIRDMFPTMECKLLKEYNNQE